MQSAALPSVPANVGRLTLAERRTTYASQMAQLAAGDPANGERITQHALRTLANRAQQAAARRPLIPRALS